MSELLLLAMELLFLCLREHIENEGCQNCYVYFLDRMRGKSGSDIYKTKTGFKYPLSKDRTGKYKIQSGQIEQVACGGENYGGSRPCDFDWVKALRNECVSKDVTFCFMETGTVFIKDGKKYRINNKQMQNLQAHKSGLTYKGKEIHFKLVDSSGIPVPKEKLYVPHYREKCDECSFKILCNGCSDCGACESTDQ